MGKLIKKAHVNLEDREWCKVTRQKRTAKSFLKDVSLYDELWLCGLAFLFGMASINGLYPFGLSFTAATAFHKRKFVLVAFFSFIGNLIMLRDVTAFHYLGAILIFAAAFVIFEKIFRTKEYALGILVFLSNFLAGIVFLWFMGASIYDIFLLTMESGLACVVTFIIPGAIPWVFTQPYYKTERYICFAILSGVILSIANIQIVRINIRDVLGIFLVILMALVEGPGAGAVSGIITGITGYTLALSPWLVVLLSFSGLCAGVFSKLGKLGSIGGFSLGYLVYNLYTNSIGLSFVPLATVGIAYILILLFPQNIIDKLKLYFEDTPGFLQRGQNALKIIMDRLHELALLLDEFGNSFNKPLSWENNIFRSSYLNNVCKAAQFNICSSCGMYRICWGKETKRIVNSFYRLIRSYEQDFPDVVIPSIFKTRCNKLEEIKILVGNQSRIFNLNQQIKSILCKNMDLMKNTFKEASKMIRTIGNNMPENSNADKVLKEKLLENGIQTDYVYTRDIDQKMSINITKPSCKSERQCELLIPKSLKNVLGKNFYIQVLDCPLKTGSTKCRIKAMAKGNIGVAVGIAGIAKTDCDVSGDGFSFMELKNGKYMLALSDGMGVGKEAAIHSEKTLSVLERLLENGFEPKIALELVNTAMILLSAGHEGFSTLDLTIVDVYNGKTEFIKSGSPATFIKRGSRVSVLKSSSLPVGIVEEISPSRVKKALKVGDIIVMLTDGVLEAFSGETDTYKALCEYLNKIEETNPQEIANMILKKAKDNAAIKDDMTVLVAKLWQRSV